MLLLSMTSFAYTVLHKKCISSACVLNSSVFFQVRFHSKTNAGEKTTLILTDLDFPLRASVKVEYLMEQKHTKIHFN